MALIETMLLLFYLLPKPQKDPIEARPICAAHHSIASIAHRIIVRALRCVEQTLRKHDDDTFKNGGLRTNLVIKSSAEFIVQSPRLLTYALTADVNEGYVSRTLSKVPHRKSYE